MGSSSDQPPAPGEMTSTLIQPGRKWVPLSGAFRGQAGTEFCATPDFSWIGLMFPGETCYHAFRFNELLPVE